MATSPRRLCQQPGCANLVKRGYCKQHARSPSNYRNPERQGVMPLGHLYSTPRWRQLRAYHLSIQPTCVMCGAKGTILDHVNPHHGNEEAFWAGPFQVLCPKHHGQKSAKHDGWRAQSLKGY